MVKQFLKMAGARNEKEFLSMFPNEESFFRAYPEAEMLVNGNNQMAYGGAMYHYAPGGPIKPGTLSTAVKEAMAAQSMQTPSVGVPPLLARPADQMDNFVGPIQPPQYAQAAPAITPQYQGVSIADMLSSRGEASDFASRKARAEEMGISGYRGTPAQNRQLMEMMGGKFAGTINEEASQRSSGKASGSAKNLPVSKRPKVDEDTREGYGALPYLGTAGAAALGYGAYKGTQAELNAIKGMGNLYKGKSAQEISKLIKARGFRLPGDFEQLAKAGMNPSKVMGELKGLRFIEGATKDGLAAAQQANVFQKTAKSLEQARPIAETYVNRFKNAKPILDKIKTAGIRSAADVEALRAAGLSSKETMVALKGIPMAKVAATAQNAGKWGDAFKAGITAFREAPLIKAGLKAMKFREYGGEEMAYGGMYDDGGMYAYGGISGQNPHPGTYSDGYSGTFSGGNYFPDGGTFIPQPMMMPGQLPEYGYGRAMYGAGMAYGGGYSQGGSYSKGSVHDMDESQIQELINQGYKIEYV